MKPQVKTLKDGYEAPTITSFAMSLEAGLPNLSTVRYRVPLSFRPRAYVLFADSKLEPTVSVPSLEPRVL